MTYVYTSVYEASIGSPNSAPSDYLNQCWVVRLVRGNCSEIWIKNTFFFQETTLENVVCDTGPIYLGLNTGTYSTWQEFCTLFVFVCGWYQSRMLCLLRPSLVWWRRSYNYRNTPVSVKHPLKMYVNTSHESTINSLTPRLNRRPFTDDIFKCIFLNENEWISPRISLKFVPKVRINNIQALVQIMAWRRPSDKPLSEPVMVSLLTHIYVTRPQWAWADDKTRKTKNVHASLDYGKLSLLTMATKTVANSP